MASVENREKAKALDLAIASIEKQFGKGSIMKLGDGKSFYERCGRLQYRVFKPG